MVEVEVALERITPGQVILKQELSTTPWHCGVGRSMSSSGKSAGAHLYPGSCILEQLIDRSSAGRNFWAERTSRILSWFDSAIKISAISSLRRRAKIINLSLDLLVARHVIQFHAWQKNLAMSSLFLL